MALPALSPAQCDRFVAYARQRHRDRTQQMQQRQQAGFAQATQAAALLKAQFGVQDVFLFGSLLTPERVHPASDIDLAVWGLSSDLYCEAVGTLLCTVQGFTVDVVRLEVAPPSLLDCVKTQGVRL